jgi:small subunit ribosomal protein S2
MPKHVKTLLRTKNKMMKNLTIDGKAGLKALHCCATERCKATHGLEKTSPNHLESRFALLWLKRLIQSGGHIGHRPLKLSLSRACYPAMSNSLIGERGKGAVINPSITLKQTAKGLFLAASVLRQKGHILVIDTRGETSPMKSLIENCNRKIPPSLSFSGNRWIGGSLTNWGSISQMICRSAQISRKFEAFLKANRIHLPRYEKIKQAYPGFLMLGEGGVQLRLTRHPDLLFVINPNENRHVIEEAKTLKIPVVALVDSNTNLSRITVPVPVNSNPMLWSNYVVTTLIDVATSLSPSMARGGPRTPRPCIAVQRNVAKQRKALGPAFASESKRLSSWRLAGKRVEAQNSHRRLG